MKINLTMKKISLLFIVVMALAISFQSCKKDDFTEEDAIKLINAQENTNDSLNIWQEYEADRLAYLYQDSVTDADKIVYLNIHVINASYGYVNKSTGGTSSLKALSGATVTVATEEGVETATTGDDGVVSFTIIKGGSCAITVAATDFTTLDLQTVAIPNGGFYSLQAPLLSLTTGTMTVSGKLTYESDLTNPGREDCAGAVVRVDPDFSAFGLTNINSFTYSGFPTTTTSAADGTYSISVPADAAGMLDYSLTVEDVEANQVLLANDVNGAETTGPGFGAQTVPAVFGSGLTASAIPTVAPVYAVFGAPDHTFTPATLVATIGGDAGIDYIIDNSAGMGYDGNVQIYIPNSNPAGTPALVSPNVNGDGEILSWAVTGGGLSGGSEFTAVPTIPLGFTKVAAANLTYVDNGDGFVGPGDGINIPTAEDGGLYLTEELTCNIAGVEFTFSAAADDDGNGSYRRITGANFPAAVTTTAVTNGQAITATVSSSNVVATATAVLETSGVTSVSVTDGGSGYPAGGTYDILFEGGSGSGADYEATIGANGSVIEVTLKGGGDEGEGYTSVPTATVDWVYNPETATTDVNVSPANVVSTANLDGGTGYDVAPTLTFYSQAVADQQITELEYTVNISGTAPWNVTGVAFTQDELTTVAKNINASANSEVPAGGVTINAQIGANLIRNYYLGTGTRVNVN